MREKVLSLLEAVADWWQDSTIAYCLKVSLICGGLTGALAGGLATLIFKLATGA